MSISKYFLQAEALIFLSLISFTSSRRVCPPKYIVEPMKATPFTVLGEAPHWDIQRQSLYFIDINDGAMHRYDFNENRTYTCKIEGINVVSFIIPVTNTSDQFILGAGRNLTLAQWDGINSLNCSVIRVIRQIERNKPNNRFNDGKVDPEGRLFAGTMENPTAGVSIFDVRQGSLYRYSRRLMRQTTLLTNIGISNGLTWNLSKSKFYYIDSIDLNVKEFDYNSTSGSISNPRIIISFDKSLRFIPDGMTIDNKGMLYVALNGGSAVYKIDPDTGKILLKIKIPAEQVTSLAWGGPNLGILYVTTANTTLLPELNPPNSPLSGILFSVKGLKANGLPMNTISLN